ncbi:hypothetical protein FGO68_gene7124 [Halteria grandinella]|uniref:Glutathione S-transferase n=1 Tax=Halteria grandinella TaxID=5974 RepID=A0A8J8NKQ7_HALGN|nr:hypothetical protein FGO68_gene7124 [Halteria grandinella]
MASQVDPDLQTLYITDESTPKPAVNTKYPRIYGHLLCPYVEKARIAFAARGIQYQSVEVDLGKKTPWHLAINGGLVPVLELPDGTIINESKIIMEFAEEAYPGSGFSLLPEDPVARAKVRAGSLLLDGFNAAYFPIYLKKTYDEADFVKLRDSIQKIENFLSAHAKEGSPFALGTPAPNQLDTHIYAHLERLAMLKDSGLHWVWEHSHLESYPHILKLLAAFRETPAFSNGRVLANPKPWREFIGKMAEKPPGERVQLYLPISNE